MAETLTDPLLGRLIDGRYEVRERIAAGGMATVYLALDKRLERLVAVKVMHAAFGRDSEQGEFASRFRREAKAAARLTHPGLVRVYDQGTDGDLSYLTMEYVDGENLRTRLLHESTLTVGESLAMIDAILDALSAAHRLGLVHRDVKPENVLIDEDGRPKLADFGLARAVTEVTSTSTGTVMGTVAYLAPELVQRGEADARTDVYAVGIMLFEALTGRQPFTAPSAIEVATRHVHEDVPAPSTYAPWLPAEIDLLVLTLASRDPAGRPSNATAALAMVRQTRAMIDEPTLDRKADPPSGTYRLVDDADDDADATTVFDLTPPGSTIALPIGLNEPLFAPVEAELIDDDPDAVAPARSRPRWTLWVVAIVAALLLTLGLGAWWYNTQGPGAYTIVPPVTEKTADEAQAILSAAGLNAIVITEYSDAVPAGIVIRTSPAAQERIAKNDTVKIVLSEGPRMQIVPGVVGKTEGDAIDALSKAEFSVGTTDRVYSDTVPSGQVMSTDPVADTSVRHDLPINMVVSQGPQPITIPDLKGLTEEQAKAQLAAFNMNVITQTGRTLDVNKGEVYKTDPAAGSASTRTATITLYVSEGKPQVQVPDFVGSTVAQARALADSSGLKVDISPQWNTFINGPETDNKIIVAQTPDPGPPKVEVDTTIYLKYK
ncbi:Stk1 family PASTA domain-containing Ser/Thr kinase [Demequina lutea]|uniref:non-specific serine/threonine protein kinase n=1 Tax=Demequina lutea TaxID=431489 RepID=A0A7Z0CHV7_9MICO|nr:Stk1 family PASTA domain-containing Ser/Thr kinase [Demequina lutea]NYI41234.1 serine/threonine-protein kinase [Demequina lutea]